MADHEVAIERAAEALAVRLNGRWASLREATKGLFRGDARAAIAAYEAARSDLFVIEATETGRLHITSAAHPGLHLYCRPDDRVGVIHEALEDLTAAPPPPATEEG